MSHLQTAESQRQRWLKYGLNVVVSSVIVIAIAVMAVYLVQSRARRIDTTASGLYSLKPQTIGVIRENEKPVKIVSLHKLPPPPRDPTADEQRAWEERNAEATRRHQILRDLLKEYQSKGRNITFDAIDTLKEPAKENALIAEVEQKYGGELQAYRDFLASYSRQHDEIVRLCAFELEEIKKLTPPQDIDRETRATFREIVNTVDGFPALLEAFRTAIDRELKKKVPDYRGAVEMIRDGGILPDTGIAALSTRVEAIVQRLNQSRDNQKVPQVLRDYMTASLPRYQAIKQICDQVTQTIDGLGDLKLDTLRRSLQQRDPILVMGQSDIRIIPADQIWKSQVDRAGRAEAKLKPQFAGEQLITTSILSINNPLKKKVAFIRPGGPPLTDMGFLGMQSGVMSAIGQRLRDYNFDVVEKDLSGQWAMQSQMRGMPAEPEPSDDELKSAIWVVLAFPTQMGMPSPIGERLKQHLDQGGSALVMAAPRVGGLEEALKDWGIEIKSDLVAVHEAVDAPDGRLPDEVQDALRSQMIFLLNQYGDHPITRPLASLDSLMIFPVPVATHPAEGVAVSSILPLSSDLKTWGESDPAAMETGERVSFDTAKGDVSGPLNAGAAAEKHGGGRVVVIGCPRFAFDFPEITLRDEELEQQNIRAARFPGNGELFMNSIFWLSGLDSMIAISPAAMEVSRIRPMSHATLNAWRIGLLLVGIPGAVVAAGLVMYMKRRD